MKVGRCLFSNINCSLLNEVLVRLLVVDTVVLIPFFILYYELPLLYSLL